MVTTDDGNTYGPSYAEIVQLDMATVRETMQSLAGNALQVKSHSHGKITGSITLADDQQAVMTSIPYDKGWIILVDGKKVNYTTYADTFMQFKCSPGKHTVEFRYVCCHWSFCCDIVFMLPEDFEQTISWLLFVELFLNV